MKKIQVYDPVMCCSTGVCGVEVDAALVLFSADADWARKQGAVIERFNLATQPMDFVKNPRVKATAMSKSAAPSLPCERARQL